MQIERESQFELVRIVSMISIVYYHLFSEMTNHLYADYPIYLGVQIPMHLGVLLFVIISGYFGITPSVRGMGRLILMVLVYFLPLTLYRDFVNNDLMGGVKDFFIVSHPRYWFFRDYLFLYLFSPIINKFLEGSSHNKRLYLIVILSFMAVWVGTLSSYKYLSDGKNLTNFLLLYVVGNTLKEYRQRWVIIPQWKLLLSFIIINTIVITIWGMTYNSSVSKLVWSLSFPYCSPILYLNAIIVFMMFGKLNVQSQTINWIASSVFAIYLIHYNPVIWQSFIKLGADYILSVCYNSPLGVIPLYLVYAVIICMLCIIIDKLLHPLWNYSNKKFVLIDQKLNGSND